jgi:hypothetical protein
MLIGKRRDAAIWASAKTPTKMVRIQWLVRTNDMREWRFSSTSIHHKPPAAGQLLRECRMRNLSVRASVFWLATAGSSA